MQNRNLSRRDFVKISAVGAGMLALGGVNASAAMNSKDVKWDEEFDVVIIGSGFAALAATVKASEKGYKILLVEKMGRLGGNSVINGGLAAFPHNPLQDKEGVKDSNELFLKDCLKAGLNINHKDLLETIANRAKDALALTLKCGVQYRDRLEHLGGHSVPRTYGTTNGSGSGIVLPMIEYVKKIDGVTIKTRTKFDEFILDDSGRVVGIKAREDYKFDKSLMDDDRENKSGTTKFFKAGKGVILASGGFCRDVFYRQIQDPRLDKDADSTNHPGATAGGLMAALAIGAVPVQVSWLQFGPWGCADESGFGVGALFNVNASFRYGISVDPKTGKRYMNELADRKIRSDAMFIVIGKDKNYPINFCDSVAVKDILPDQLNKPLEAGILKKFDTLDALAAEYKIPAAELKKTVEQYNKYVKDGKDPDFGKPVDMIGGVTISTPPFYAMRGVPKLHHSMGGVNINTKAQVISIYNKKPIPGLYAAGEVTGGVHGASRLGSNAITDCLTFGMIAGENI